MLRNHSSSISFYQQQWIMWRALCLEVTSIQLITSKRNVGSYMTSDWTHYFIRWSTLNLTWLLWLLLVWITCHLSFLIYFKTIVKVDFLELSVIYWIRYYINLLVPSFHIISLRTLHSLHSSRRILPTGNTASSLSSPCFAYPWHVMI